MGSSPSGDSFSDASPSAPGSSDDSPRHPRVSLAIPGGALRERLRSLLRDAHVDLDAVEAEDQDLRALLEASDADVVLVRRSQIEGDPREVLEGVDDAPEVIVLGEAARPEERGALLAAGVSSVLSVDSPPGELRERIESLAEVAAGGGRDGPDLGGDPAEPRLEDFESRSPRMRELMDRVRRVLAADSSLLILGETGVGKERLARAIHAASPRSEGPFVVVNCGALAESLLESELFGHVKGAFTGASADRRGRFEEAAGGTIFLDEIAEMPASLQVKLLNVLQRHEITPVGGEGVRRVDVRVLSATHRDLAEEVRAGRFRADLYFRIHVVPLVIPPLRERREDLPDIIGLLVHQLRERVGRPDLRGFSPAAFRALLEYAFPGNLRELIHIVERGMLLARGAMVEPEDLPEEVLTSASVDLAEGEEPTGRADRAATGWSLNEAPWELEWTEARRRVLEKFEAEYLRRWLRRTRGAVGQCAQRAGLSSRSLYDKMRRHGLRKEDFRDGARD